MESLTKGIELIKSGKDVMKILVYPDDAVIEQNKI